MPLESRTQVNFLRRRKRVLRKEKHKLARRVPEQLTSARFRSGKKAASPPGAARPEPGATRLHKRDTLGSAMFSAAAWEELARSLKLSGQELRIVCGVFDDCTEAEMADKLKVSRHTIHTHCERLYRKLGVGDRVKLVLRIVEHHLALVLSGGNRLPPICADFAGGACPLRLPRQ
jgi:ATP/maltotriose-dependent transcriptional regulator MalT